jgi:hypothetical protein
MEEKEIVKEKQEASACNVEEKVVISRQLAVGRAVRREPRGKTDGDI